MNKFEMIGEDLYNTALQVFESEDTMKASWAQKHTIGDFDRTQNARIFCTELFRSCWNKLLPDIQPLSTDHIAVLRTIENGDFNLISQLLLNLQPSMRFLIDMERMDKVMTKRLEAMKVAGCSLDPIASKAKYASADETNKDWVEDYNKVLGCAKARGALNFSNIPSYRVSPLGSTPAISDSANLSMLNPSVDEFLIPMPGYYFVYISWENTPQICEMNDQGDFIVQGTSSPFRSKSGGDILNKALFSRRLVAALYKLGCIVNFVPRLGSVMLVCDNSVSSLQRTEDMSKILSELRFEYHMGGSR